VTRPLDWAKASFQEAMEQKPARIEFPAWKDESGQPFACFVFPQSVQDLDEITKATRVSQVQGLVMTIVRRARKEDKSRIFSDPERIVIMKECSGDDICDLAHAINTAVPGADHTIGGGPGKP